MTYGVRAFQVIENIKQPSPEKAGVGGSIPSLATIILSDLDDFTAFLQPTIQPMIHCTRSVSR